MTTTRSDETPGAGRSTCTPRWPGNYRDCGMNSRSAASKAASRPGFTRLRIVTVTAASSLMAGLSGAVRGHLVEHGLGVLHTLPVSPRAHGQEAVVSLHSLRATYHP